MRNRMKRTITWAITKLYSVKFYTNYNQIHEWRVPAYSIEEAVIIAGKKFNANCLKDEKVTKALVVDLKMKVF